MIVKKLLLISLFLSLFFSFSLIDVFAKIESTLEIPREQINPDAGSMFLIKRFQEKVFLFFKFSSVSKIEYYQVLLDKRLGELVYVVDNKDIAHIEATSSRYESTAGQLVQTMFENKKKNKFSEIKRKFIDHILFLSEVQSIFLPSTAEWRFIENDINSLKIYIQQINDY